MALRTNLAILLVIVAGLVACSTEFNTDVDGDAPDAFDASTEPGPDLVPDGGSDVIPDGGPECGDGDVEGDEQCDDGNDVDGDGCDNDCRYSCEGDEDCLDDNECNGVEICDGDSHMCEAGTVLDDGHLLDVGPPRIICIDGHPAESTCGDGFVDEAGGEFCEPPGSGGCNDDCRWGCDSDTECPDDGVLCNGEEFCDTTAHACDRRNVPTSGTSCDDGLFCTTDETCDGMGTCTGGDATCVDGLTCTDDRCDESADSCNHPLIAGNCLIGGSCFGDGVVNPGDECEECRSSTSTSAFVDRSDGSSCTADSYSCTDDVCEGGSCNHPIVSSWCLIGSTCYSDGTHDPGNECRECDDGTSQTSWTTRNGAVCDDGEFCTAGDSCTSSATCVGTPVLYLSGAEQISAGLHHGCAIVDTDRLRCWGYNNEGQVGDGSVATRSGPVDVTGLTSGVAYVGAGQAHTCAVTTAGAARCWGDNSEGQLGNGSTTDSRVPIAVSGLSSGVDTICGGYFHTCALLTSGEISCWGRNAYGQLGNATFTDTETPILVVPPTGGGALGGIVEIDCGNYHTCARNGSGNVLCWGSNYQGQLGGGETTPTTMSRPTYVDTSTSDGAMLSSVVQIGLGGNHSCARMSDRRLKCWGAGTDGQLGTGFAENRSAPSYVLLNIMTMTFLADVAEVSGGSNHTCARLTSNNVMCWGLGEDGQLGNLVSGPGVMTTQPVFVLDATGVNFGPAFALSLGGWHSLVIAETSDWVMGWGRNDFGQLGLGGVGSDRASPFHTVCRY
ncbi:MAG: hypothetical protein JRG91_07980 [Deltaproteobacteria bacterium]|nr:hypothetical protein [Deltaproteobacteria bacterium]